MVQQFAPAWAHGLSLSKSLIKKPRNIIRVGSDCQTNQTQLGSTKPNTPPPPEVEPYPQGSSSQAESLPPSKNS